MKTDVTKQKYLRPAIAVFDMMEDKLLLATSPNVRPGGGGTPSGNIRRIAHFAG